MQECRNLVRMKNEKGRMKNEGYWLMANGENLFAIFA
jgi:hypothetical protein